MKNVNNISLLQDISSQEIEELITEYKLEEKGYKFFYFIDNYDISKYTFPFGLIPSMDLDNRKNLPIEIITDEQLAYDFIIHKEKKMLLFNEHIEEINNYINKIKWIEYYSDKIINTSEELIKYFEERKNNYIRFDDQKELYDIIYSDNISLLVSIALGLLYDGKQKLKNIVDTVLLSDINKLEPEITDIIKKCEPGKKTEILFENLIKNYKAKSINRLVSKYNKCKIFDKLLCINNKSKGNNYLYYLLSSSKTVSQRLSNIANHLGFSIYVNNYRFKPVKTIAQIYLQLLLSNNEDKIDYLQKLKEIVILKENSDEKTFKDENELINYFEQKSSHLRGSFENASLFLNFHNYRKQINMVFKKNILSMNEDIKCALENLIKLSKDRENWKKIQSTSLSEIRYLREYSIILKSALEDIEKGKGALSGFSGQDYVDSPFHSLPFVFFNKTDKYFNTILDETISLITESHLGKISSTGLVHSIKKSFNLLFDKPITVTTDEEKVIMLLTLLLLKRENEFKPNEIAYDWVSDILNKKIYDENWHLDFIYLKSWIARRTKRYDEAIDLAKIGINKNNEDPRFYQSLYLNYYCLFRENGKYEYLNTAIENCHISYDKYEKHEKSKAIKKSIAAILNSLSYLYTIKYEKTKDSDDIKQARKSIDILKNEYEDYDYSPEFQHTEAVLEWNEYLASDNEQKLCSSLKSIERAINILNKDIYFELKSKIIERIKQLNIKCNYKI